jgi:Ser/Thr protein kinase RdoA (MazF antagonist)
MPAARLRLFERNVPEVAPSEAAELLKSTYGIEGELHDLGGERDLNFRVDSEDGRFVFKIGNTEDGADVVDFQLAAIRHIRERDSSLPVPEIRLTRGSRAMEQVTTKSGASHILRLVNYLPGIPVGSTPVTPRTWREIGALMGRLNVALGSFFHHAARANDHPWDTANCLRYQVLAEHIADTSARKLVNRTFDRFRDHVKPRLDATRHQVIHQDAHSGNVLVDPNDPGRVTGLIDFGDILYGPVIADLAIVPDRTEQREGDLLDVICNAAVGFDATFPLEEGEIDLLFDIICARYALGATIVSARSALHANEPQHMNLDAAFVEALDELMTIGAEAGTRAIRRACRFPPALIANDEDTLPAMQGTSTTGPCISRKPAVRSCTQPMGIVTSTATTTCRRSVIAIHMW